MLQTENKEIQNTCDLRTAIKQPSSRDLNELVKLIVIDKRSSIRPSVDPKKETVNKTDEFATCDDNNTVVNLDHEPLRKGVITKPR